MDDTESTEITSTSTEETEVALEQPKPRGGLASRAKKSVDKPVEATTEKIETLSKEAGSDSTAEPKTKETSPAPKKNTGITAKKTATASDKAEPTTDSAVKAAEPKKASPAPKKKTVGKKTSGITAKKIAETISATKTKSTNPPTEANSDTKDAAPKAGLRRKGPIGGKNRKPVKVHKSEFGMRMCIRCPLPFEPVEADEVVCPKCKGHVETRFAQLFGDEDPYSPQPTLRTNKIARVIIRKNSNHKDEPERDIAEESLEAIDRYDDD
jgi:hypothetical protein